MSVKRLFSALDKASQGLKLGSSVLNITRAYTEMAIPLSPAAKKFNRAMVPLHAALLPTILAEPIDMGKNCYEAIKAPKHLKMLPLLQLGVNVGNIFDALGTAIWICEELGASGIQALSAAALPITGVGLAFQALGIPIHLLKICNIQKEWRGIKKILGSNPKATEYKAAVAQITSIPLTKKARYTQKFFGVLSDKQKTVIQSVYDKSQTENLPNRRLNKMFKLLANHYVHQKQQHGISVALMAIGCVGVSLLAFAPTPVAPVAWGILGSLGVVSILLLIFWIRQTHQFNHSLKALS